mmetsp:Transcript_3725/g.8002  ORF Transcript_3725/g.8002 Transcript_3725/m.8002 type:complete len:263 (-) Transcript_3725:605-1393(-)
MSRSPRPPKVARLHNIRSPGYLRQARSDALNELLENGDMQLVFPDGSAVKAYKGILMAASPSVLKPMLECTTPGADGLLALPVQDNKEDWLAVLDQLHTGSLQCDLSMALQRVDHVVTRRALSIAHKYDMRVVSERCISIASSSMEPSEPATQSTMPKASLPETLEWLLLCDKLGLQNLAAACKGHVERGLRSGSECHQLTTPPCTDVLSRMDTNMLVEIVKLTALRAAFNSPPPPGPPEAWRLPPPLRYHYVPDDEDDDYV